jgi:hypothetical protein
MSGKTKLKMLLVKKTELIMTKECFEMQISPQDEFNLLFICKMEMYHL